MQAPPASYNVHGFPGHYVRGPNEHQGMQHLGFQHTYRRDIFAAIALARNEQRAIPQVFVHLKEALQAGVQVRCNLKLIRGDTPLACIRAAPW